MKSNGKFRKEVSFLGMPIALCALVVLLSAVTVQSGEPIKSYFLYGCTEVDSLNISVTWDGLAPLQLTSNHKFSAAGDLYEGFARFAIASSFYDSSKKVRDLEIPREVMTDFLIILKNGEISKSSEGSLEMEAQWTDDQTNYELSLDLCGERIYYFTKELNDGRLVWVVSVSDQEYYVDAQTPENALQILLPHMKNETFWAMKAKALNQPAMKKVMGFKLKKAGNAFDTVYFDTGKHRLKGEFMDTIYKISVVMRKNKNIEVLAAGHCDERGSSEYNFVLGDKRANTIIQHLAKLGVNSVNIHPISYGEEKPTDERSGETAWKKNRRVEFYVFDWEEAFIRPDSDMPEIPDNPQSALGAPTAPPRPGSAGE